uniref:Uncharacterized protein n=1 Tax=Tanacetum cinerariifolium TaxID=118510 RepID=A0A6L2NVE2_TANCI|nr:hypothetical protein [Tanacetum cinerariifolium]
MHLLTIVMTGEFEGYGYLWFTCFTGTCLRKLLNEKREKVTRTLAGQHHERGRMEKKEWWITNTLTLATRSWTKVGIDTFQQRCLSVMYSLKIWKLNGRNQAVLKLKNQDHWFNLDMERPKCIVINVSLSERLKKLLLILKSHSSASLMSALLQITLEEYEKALEEKRKALMSHPKRQPDRRTHTDAR